MCVREVGWNGASETPDQRQARSDVRRLGESLWLYREVNGQYPTTEAGLVALDVSEELLTDPWGNPYRYERLDDTVFAVSIGPDGQADTFDDILEEAGPAATGADEDAAGLPKALLLIVVGVLAMPGRHAAAGIGCRFAYCAARKSEAEASRRGRGADRRRTLTICPVAFAARCPMSSARTSTSRATWRINPMYIVAKSGCFRICRSACLLPALLTGVALSAPVSAQAPIDFPRPTASEPGREAPRTRRLEDFAGPVAHR